MDLDGKEYLLNLLEDKKMKLLRDEIITYNEADIAEFLEEINPVQCLTIFRLLPQNIESEVFSFLENEAQESLLKDMTNAEFTEIVDNLYIDDMVDMLEELTAVSGVIAFLPMLTGAGGNAGSQASTMVIRGLSLGEIEIEDYYKVFFKELGVSLIVGIGLAIVNFFRIFIMDKNLGLALTVSLSLIFTIMIAKVAGGLLPIFAKKLNLDPTVMAAPLIATIVDTLSLLIYVLFIYLILV